jgi:hypothetical protein
VPPPGRRGRHACRPYMLRRMPRLSKTSLDGRVGGEWLGCFRESASRGGAKPFRLAAAMERGSVGQAFLPARADRNVRATLVAVSARAPAEMGRSRASRTRGTKLGAKAAATGGTSVCSSGGCAGKQMLAPPAGSTGMIGSSGARGRGRGRGRGRESLVLNTSAA